MRWMSIVCGLLLMVAGSVAAITGDFGGVGAWFLAFGLGVIGFAGLVGTAVTGKAASGS